MSAHGKIFGFQSAHEGSAHREHFEIQIFCSWAAEIPIFARNPKKAPKSLFYEKPHGKASGRKI